jgi:hypothetical protein
MESDGKIYLYTDQPNRPKVRLGGPYITEKAATAASKDVSRAIGEDGSVKEYRKYLKMYPPHPGGKQYTKTYSRGSGGRKAR